MNEKFLEVGDVMQILGISRSAAYKLMRQINSELEKKGYIVIRGKVSRKYLLHAKFEVAERIWFYLIPTAQGRVKWLRKHKKLAMLGEHVHWQPRKYPTDGNMLKVHDNVAIASNVEFTMHDIIHWIFDGMEGHRCFQEFADCIEINENVFIGAGARILPGVSVGPNAIVAAGAIVNKDVLPGTVVGGVPARVIGSFEDLMKNRKMYSDMIQSVKANNIDVDDFLWNEFSKNHKIEAGENGEEH